jgi:hypothetical protein
LDPLDIRDIVLDVVLDIAPDNLLEVVVSCHRLKLEQSLSFQA